MEQTGRKDTVITMRLMAFVGVGLVAALAPVLSAAGSSITVPTIAIGRNLQAWTTLKLGQPAPEGGVEVKLHSDDPARLLLAKSPDAAGSAEITLKIVQGRLQSPDFCLQALADSGTATYTLSAAGFETTKGTVTFAPSAILIVGPYGGPRFPTTPRGRPSKISVVSARLDAAGKVAEEQPILGGASFEVKITNSNSAAGELEASKVILSGGSSAATTYFKPAAEGSTTLAAVQPPGFKSPAERGSVTAAVEKPPIAIAGDIYIGKDLQVYAVMALGEPAPAEGLKVTLTSEDASKLVISDRDDQLGSGSTTILVPAGKQNAVYYLQGLGDSGTVSYKADAPGFKPNVAKVGLARSGVMITYYESGPPEEGNVLRKSGVHKVAEIYTSITEAKRNPVRLVAWTAYIDDASGRAADFTVEPLRPGASARVILSSSDATVGTVESPLVIQPGTNRVVAQFTPLKKGKTVITLETPTGFSAPKNATSIPAIVSE
jgi:hypothetical protein